MGITIFCCISPSGGSSLKRREAALKRIVTTPSKPHDKKKPSLAKKKKEPPVMAVQERIDAHIKWLNDEIADCEAKFFNARPKGKAYLETLRASLMQFERLKHTITQD